MIESQGNQYTLSGKVIFSFSTFFVCFYIIVIVCNCILCYISPGQNPAQLATISSARIRQRTLKCPNWQREQQELINLIRTLKIRFVFETKFEDVPTLRAEIHSTSKLVE